MESDARGGISRTGAEGAYTCAAKENMADKPVGYVSFWNACRFCNWMHHGSPSGPQGDATTEDGAYTLAPDRVAANSVFRNPSAVYFIPSENEWHKAAFHEPGAGWIRYVSMRAVPTGYWRCATRSNSDPLDATADLVGNILTSPPVDASNIANQNQGAQWNSQDGNVTTVGSGGPGNATFYGAFDMSGNMPEWTEGGAGQLGARLAGRFVEVHNPDRAGWLDESAGGRFPGRRLRGEDDLRRPPRLPRRPLPRAVVPGRRRRALRERKA